LVFPLAHTRRWSRGLKYGLALKVEEMEPRRLRAGDVALAAAAETPTAGVPVEAADGGDSDFLVLGDAVDEAAEPLAVDDRLSGRGSFDPVSLYGGNGPYGGYAPIIENFLGEPGLGNVWTFTGTVRDDGNVSGLTVTLGGVLPSGTATVQSNGTFIYQVELAEGTYGNATAEVKDVVNNPSPTATFPVD
jgi:hypothetical protein